MSSAIDRLHKVFSGEILFSEHTDFNSTRKIFNAMVDKHPSVITQCANAQDVVSALRFGREQGLDISVRSGGHHVAGWSVTDGGLMIDMRPINKVKVDPSSCTAQVGGGAIWSEVDHACQPHGLATTGGAVSTLGVAGFTLGGGKGWLQGKYGYACDNLLSVELVTAGGKVIVASEDEHSDLFWALHGGGGNFGVATSFSLRLHPLKKATFVNLIYSPEAGPALIRRYRDVIEAGVPRELNMYIYYLTGPQDDYMPKHLVDKLCVALGAFYPGPESKILEAMAPLLELEPEVKIITEKPYADIQSSLDTELGVAGNRVYSSAEHLLSFPDKAVDKFCARAYDMIVPSRSTQELLVWGHSAADLKGDWPIAHLDAPWAVSPFGQWTDPEDDERAITWAKALCADMAPYAGGGAYLNVSVYEGRERTIEGYGGRAKYERLARVKAEYDPDNVFHLNHNIEPG